MKASEEKEYLPHLIAWEITKRCHLSCLHCRAGASKEFDSSLELSTAKIFRILEDIASFSKPIIILTGGEALLHKDVFEIIQYGKSLGFSMTISSCGIPINEEIASRLKYSGIQRISISLDGKDAQTHDFIRGADGVFEKAIKAIDLLKKEKIEFQINTLVTQHNFNQIEDILNLAIEKGAVSFHPFFLVPVGRARNMRDSQLDARQFEDILNKLYERTSNSIDFRPTCAPHYFRILVQHKACLKKFGLNAKTIGCMGGKSFCFISSIGKVQICGFMEVDCGNLNVDSFKKIWQDSSIFNELRDFKTYKGKCGYCEYLEICGGCRARAFEEHNDYLAEETLCLYQPRALAGDMF